MNFSFKCPFPCEYNIKVRANNQDDAVDKIISAGGMRCRNEDHQCSCDKTGRNMYPMPKNDLHNVVRLYMQQE